jgi:ribosome biogenesis protein BMS1
MSPTMDSAAHRYGYVRGTHLKPNMKMHVIGAGDFAMSTITLMEDPCPPPYFGKTTKPHTLNDKERVRCSSLSSSQPPLSNYDKERTVLFAL